MLTGVNVNPRGQNDALFYTYFQFINLKCSIFLCTVLIIPCRIIVQSDYMYWFYPSFYKKTFGPTIEISCNKASFLAYNSENHKDTIHFMNGTTYIRVEISTSFK